MSFKTLARLGPFQLQRIVCDILYRLLAIFRRRPEPKPVPTDSATVAAIIAACDP